MLLSHCDLTKKKDEKDDGEEDKGETEVKCRNKCVCLYVCGCVIGYGRAVYS